MLIELLSMSNYANYNIKVAKVLGLHPAIYLSEVMSINEKAIRKNKIDGHYFKLDRGYLTSRTTFNEEEQLSIEASLLKIGILEKADEKSNLMFLNLNVLTSIIMTPDESLLADITKLAEKKTKKRSKSDAISDNLKLSIVTTNDELRKAYCDWIDTVYAKQGWMSKKSVVDGQNLIDSYSKRDLDLALKLLSIASINGYRDIQWAINNYEKNYNVQYQFQQIKPIDKNDVKVGKQF